MQEMSEKGIKEIFCVREKTPIVHCSAQRHIAQSKGC